ncbi:hypothetical protein [Exiguobacterium flavidum]|uniref:hypothetical protein n=1 Tax=Exiguobacterium flavidum TaxID=2184695 RepID=UPI000DF73418|nr:hypothetical protein [Exiguobacterium flavidum]
MKRFDWIAFVLACLLVVFAYVSSFTPFLQGLPVHPLTLVFFAGLVLLVFTVFAFRSIEGPASTIRTFLALALVLIVLLFSAGVWLFAQAFA